MFLGLDLAIWIVLVLYFAGMLLLGWWSKRQVRNREGYLLGESVRTLDRKARGMKNFVWGCGCVSYNTPREHVLRFKDMCLDAGG